MSNTDNEITIKKAVFLNATAKYSTVILQIIYMVILSRILNPDEFGIVAVINVFIVFFQLVADMGFGTAVIQNKSLNHEDINNIFSYSIFLGVLLMIIFCGFSFLIAAVYINDIYIQLGFVASISLMFYSFNMIPNSVMLKEKRFGKIAIRTITVSFVSYVAAVVLAILGAGAYSLVFSSVINSFGLFIWNEVNTRLKFVFKPRFASIKKILSYSSYQFVSQTLNYFNRNLDNLLIGKVLSTEALGNYNKAYTLMQYPISYLPGVVTPALHPILSEHQDDCDYIFKKYMCILKMISILGSFGTAFCFFAANEIILIAFGSQWTEAIIPFKLLSISLWAQLLTNTTAPIYQSIGNTKTLLQSTVLTTILIVSFIIFGMFGGDIKTVALCVSIAYCLNFFVSFYMLITVTLKKSYIAFLQYFWREILIMTILFFASLMWSIEITSVVVSFLIKLTVFLAMYSFLILLLGQHKIIIGIIKAKKGS